MCSSVGNIDTNIVRLTNYSNIVYCDIPGENEVNAVKYGVVLGVKNNNATTLKYNLRRNYQSSIFILPK